MVWSNDHTTFAGHLSVAGAGGRGGFAEVSGHRLLDFTGTVDLAGSAGAGTLLLDPRNIVISSGTDSGGAFASGTYTPSADDSILNVATLKAALASGDVIITTGGAGSAGSQAGDITVADAVTWSANNLTLDAYHSISVNAALSASGNGGLTLTINDGGARGSLLINADATIAGGGAVAINTNGGDYSFLPGQGLGFTGGSGAGASLTINGTPYTLLYSLSDLSGTNTDSGLQGHYALAGNLDDNNAAFTPLGTDGAGTARNSGQGFSGSFTGLGHTISNLSVNTGSSQYAGLFGYVSGTIRDVGLIGGSTKGGSAVGALAGYSAGTITNAYASGAVVGSGDNVGGLVGYNFIGTITNAHATGTVSGHDHVGGLVGYDVGTITNAYATASVNGNNDVGGLVGKAFFDGISDAYASGTVSGNDYVGGLVGELGGEITNAYAIGAVSGGDYVGGLVGQNISGLVATTYASGAVTGSGAYIGGLVGDNQGTISSSFWDKTTTGRPEGCQGTGTCGATAVQSADPLGLNYAFYLTTYTAGGWDFADTAPGAGTWYMIVGPMRPLLQSEYSTTITNSHQLQLMNMDLSATYTLANNIAMTAELAADSNGNYPGVWNAWGFSPIGVTSNGYAQGGHGFLGVFEGNNHTISGLTIDLPDALTAGLFGYSRGDIRDLGLLGGTVAVAKNSGMHGDVGGLVGIAGVGSTITNVYSTGTVIGGSSDAGGLVGRNFGTINEAFSTGAVSGVAEVGGLVGYNEGNITQAYATGAVSALYDVGGLVGQNDTSGTITDGYYDSGTTGQASGIGPNDNGQTVTPLTTAQLQATATLPGGLTFDLGAAFSGGAAGGSVGLYPYLKSFYPNGVQAISGTAYKDAGTTPLASTSAGAAYVSAIANGVDLGSVTTGANGYYYFLTPAGTFSSGNSILAYTNANATTGATNSVTLTPATGVANQTGVDLYGNALTASTSATSLSGVDSAITAAINSAANGNSTALAAVNGTTNRYLTATGASFTIDRAVTTSGTFLVQTTGAGAPITVAAPIEVDGTGSLGLLSGGSLTIDAPITVTGAGSVALAFDSSNASNLSFGLTSTGFTGSLNFTGASGNAVSSSQGGSLAINGSVYTLVYSMSGLSGINTDSGLQGHYALAGSLDASATTGWVPLGTDDAGNLRNSYNGFSGSFTGLGHTVSNLTVDTGSASFAGLFGYATGTLRDIGVAGGSVSGSNEVGGLVGYSGGTISDAYATGTVKGYSYATNVGGLVGYDSHGTISDAYATGAVTGASGSSDVGGLVGHQIYGTISEAYATGAVTGASGSSDVGGLVGYDSHGSISEAYATGAVTASSNSFAVGGLVGNQFVGGSISEAYATGAVTGGSNSSAVGGLVGYQSGGTISNAYWDINTSGQSSDGGGADGRTTALLQGGLPSGFGSSVWGTATGLYPYLKSFFPNGVQAVSGFAYSDAGVAPLASGNGGPVYVTGLVDGARLATATTGANGYYYLLAPAGTLTGTQNLLTYVDNGSVSANTYRDAPTGTVTNLDLYGGYLRVFSGAGTASAMLSGLSTAIGGNSGSNFLYGAGGFTSGTTLDIEATNTGGFAVDSALNVAGGTLIFNASGPVSLSAALTASGLELLGSSASYMLTDGANNVDTLAADTGPVSFTDGSDLVIGTVNNTGGVTSSGAVTLVSSGNLTIAFGKKVTAGSGADVVLAAGGDFVNDEGSDAVAVSGGGRWLIYSNAPANDTFGNLDSGNTAIWNATYATLPPAIVTASGNRYLFGYQPTLTITTTDVSKTYGDDGTAAVAAAYSISGVQPGVTGAFLGDSAADVYSGTPSVTSVGSVPAAPESGNPYPIIATAGTVTVQDGYALAFSNSGALTVENQPPSPHNTSPQPPSGGNNTTSTTISFQQNQNTNPVTLTTFTPPASQNIAPGTGPDSLYPPISQFDKSQYSNDTLPDFAPQAGEATVLTMIARAEEHSRQSPKIDALWQAGAAGWPSNDNVLKNVRFTDGNDQSRTPAGNNGFAFTEGTTDIAALLQHGPVMLDGAKSAEQAAPTPWLLAIKMTADGKGIIANDPLTGDQVVLTYDPATKTVGGVTAVIDPKTHKAVLLGAGATTLAGQKTQVPGAVWTELQAFRPVSYFAVSI